MAGRMRVGILIVLPLFLRAGAAYAGLGTISAPEAQCQQAVAQSLGKLAVARAQCAVKCDQNAVKGKEPASDCTAPYAGAMFACLNDADGKAAAGMQKKCATACPTCYAGGDCATFESSIVGLVDNTLNLQAPIVFCGGTTGLTPTEVRCRQTTAIAATKFAAALSKCYAKCHQLEVKTTIPLGLCTPPMPLEPGTAACKAKAIAKYSAMVVAKCSDAPSCLASEVTVTPQPFPLDPLPPAIIQPIAANLTEDFDPQVFCR